MKKYLCVFLLLSISVWGQNTASVKMPSIFIIPSDNLLKQLKCFEMVENDGEKNIIRDYSKAFRENTSLIGAIAKIEERFSELNFTVGNLNNQLNELQNSNVENEIDGIKSDPRTKLLQSVRPDIVFELTYEFKDDPFGNSFTFVLQAIDAYSSKTIAAISSSSKTSDSNIPEIIITEINQRILKFQDDIMRHFEQVNLYGREVRLRIQVQKKSEINLELDECGDEYLSDYFQKWVKKNAKNGAFKKQYGTANEILYSEVKIELYDADGQGLGIEDWIKPIQRELKKNCGIIVVVRTVGVGDARVIISK